MARLLSRVLSVEKESQKTYFFGIEKKTAVFDKKKCGHIPVDSEMSVKRINNLMRLERGYSEDERKDELPELVHVGSPRIKKETQSEIIVSSSDGKIKEKISLENRSLSERRSATVTSGVRLTIDIQTEISEAVESLFFFVCLWGRGGGEVSN